MKEIGHLEKLADQQTLPIGDHEAVSTTMKDFPEFASLSETGNRPLSIFKKNYTHFNDTKYLYFTVGKRPRKIQF